MKKTKIKPVIKLEYVAIWRGSNILCLLLSYWVLGTEH